LATTTLLMTGRLPRLDSGYGSASDTNRGNGPGKDSQDNKTGEQENRVSAEPRGGAQSTMVPMLSAGNRPSRRGAGHATTYHHDDQFLERQGGIDHASLDPSFHRHRRRGRIDRNLDVRLGCSGGTSRRGPVNCVSQTHQGACYEFVWVNGVEVRMTFPQAGTPLSTIPNAKVQNFYVIAPQTDTPQGDIPPIHDHTIQAAPGDPASRRSCTATS
jgi:hypothetical protein